MYFIITELFGLIPKKHMHVNINKKELRGDICPIGTFPNLAGLFIKKFSMSKGKFMVWLRNIKEQKRNIQIIINVTKVFFARGKLGLIFTRKRKDRAIKISAVDGGMGINLTEIAAKSIFPESHPSKLRNDTKSIIKRSDSFLFIISKKADFTIFIIRIQFLYITEAEYKN